MDVAKRAIAGHLSAMTRISQSIINLCAADASEVSIRQLTNLTNQYEEQILKWESKNDEILKLLEDANELDAYQKHLETVVLEKVEQIGSQNGKKS